MSCIRNHIMDETSSTVKVRTIHTVDCFAPNGNVVYRPYPGAPPEYGIVIKVGRELVHVLYAGDRTPKATYPHQLDHLTPKDQS